MTPELPPIEPVEGQVELPGLPRIGHAAPALPAEDLAALQLAGQWWRDPAAKERAIRDRFGIPPVRFYQRVNSLIDGPAAQAAEPLLVGRLRRLRDGRRTRLGRTTPGGAR